VALKRHIGRLFLSLAGGVVLFIGYAVIAGPLSNLTDNEDVKSILLLPLSLPRLLIFSLCSPLADCHLSDAAYVALLFGGNIFLYWVVTYLILWLLSPKRRRRAEIQGAPPPPPDFTR
jgi:phage shock protein PspC (stress-responsive transcriptional regulator)